MIYIGIDPGQTGAMATITDNGGVAVYDFQDGDTIIWFQAHIFNAYERGNCVAVVEKAMVMPKQGIVSGFKFGVNFGTWVGRLETVGIPFDYVTPAKWKKAMFDSMPKGDQKSMSLDRARRLFPNMAEYLKRKKDHNRAEALLLAEYCRRTHV